MTRHGILTATGWFAVIVVAGIVAGRAVTGPLSDLIQRDLDTPVRTFVERPRDPVWQHLAAHVSAFGTASITGAIAALVGIGTALRTRSPKIALELAAAFAGAAAITIIVKFGVDRYPASGPTTGFTAGTFPSGHMLFAVCVYGTLGVIVGRTGAPRVVRGCVAVALAILALAIGCSRVYLLDHYASDVIASLILGVAWVAVVVSSGASSA